MSYSYKYYRNSAICFIGAHIFKSCVTFGIRYLLFEGFKKLCTDSEIPNDLKVQIEGQLVPLIYGKIEKTALNFINRLRSNEENRLVREFLLVSE